MQQTEKYQFNLIEGGDDFSPNPLNENMEKVEAQFETVTSTLAEHAAELGVGGQNCRIAYGTYKGTGTYGSDNPNSLTFDFHPIVIILAYSRYSTVMMRGVGTASSLVSGTTTLAWTEHGVSWYTNSTENAARDQNNSSGSTYYYVALGVSG